MYTIPYETECYIYVVIEISKVTGIPEEELIKKFDETRFTDFIQLYPDSIVFKKNTDMAKMAMEYMECNGDNERFNRIRKYYDY